MTLFRHAASVSKGIAYARPHPDVRWGAKDLNLEGA